METAGLKDNKEYNSEANLMLRTPAMSTAVDFGFYGGTSNNLVQSDADLLAQNNAANMLKALDELKPTTDDPVEMEKFNKMVEIMKR